MIWQKAQELYQVDQVKGMKDDFTGIIAERHELREGGYFHSMHAWMSFGEIC